MVGCKEPSGANEKARSRQIQASLICRLPAFSGLLRNPRPAMQAAPRLACVLCKTWMQPRSRNDGFSRQWCFSTIAAIWKMLDQACLNPALFHLRRISGARYKSSPIHSTGGSNQHRQVKQHRPPKVFAQLSLESAYPFPVFYDPK